MLATLYGVPDRWDDELQAKNRVAWNRYFAGNLGEEIRRKLIEEKRHPAEELTPSPEELQEVATAFAERCKASAKNLTLPAVGGHINFSNVEFEQDAFFRSYLFSRETSFARAAFCGFVADFGGATFSHWAGFSGAIFSAGADFGGATFSHWAGFSGAIFSAGADFGGATFSYRAEFDGAAFCGLLTKFGGATFSGMAAFRGAAFSGVAAFGGAAFSGWAGFDGAIFSRHASFGGATFSSNADFSRAEFHKLSNFINAKLNGETSFDGAIFKKEPPRFFGAQLHQGTVWRRIKWPPLPKHEDEAGSFVDAYACLKLEMDRLKKHEDELNFFVLELKSRRVEQGTWLGLPIAIYGAFSDYGRSYLRPLVALFYLALIGTLAFLSSDALLPLQSLGLSTANTLNVFGFRKDFFEPAVIARLPAWLDVISALQTILGAILLFLVGLGIRNKFRMK